MKFRIILESTLLLVLIASSKVHAQEEHCGKIGDSLPFSDKDKCFYYTGQYEECTAELKKLENVSNDRKDFVTREVERVKKEMDYYCR